VDRPVGAAVYGQFLDEPGGMLADVTITRLAEDRFRVLTGAGYLAADLGWIQANVRAEDGRVAVRDVTDDWTVIGLWGPRARDILWQTTSDDVSDAGIPIRTAREIHLGSGAPALATRISYAGELGWEFTVSPEWAVSAWDALVAAARDLGVGMEPVGYRALESLRLEKGFRYYGAELTTQDSPIEAGMGPFVRLGKGDFIGRKALLAARDTSPGGPARRLRTVTVGGDDWLPIFGGEAVRMNGEVVGRLRSAAFGYTVRRTVGTAYLPASVAQDTPIEVDVFDRREPGIVAPDVLHDPTGARMRG